MSKQPCSCRHLDYPTSFPRFDWILGLTKAEIANGRVPQQTEDKAFMRKPTPLMDRRVIPVLSICPELVGYETDGMD